MKQNIDLLQKYYKNKSKSWAYYSTSLIMFVYLILSSIHSVSL